MFVESVHSRIPVASSTKLATVLGAWSENSLITISHLVVLRVAYFGKNVSVSLCIFIILIPKLFIILLFLIIIKIKDKIIKLKKIFVYLFYCKTNFFSILLKLVFPHLPSTKYC